MKRMFQPESSIRESRLIFLEGGMGEGLKSIGNDAANLTKEMAEGLKSTVNTTADAVKTNENEKSYAPGYEPNKENIFPDETKNKSELDPELAKAAEDLYQKLTELGDRKADLEVQLKQAKEGSDQAGQIQVLINETTNEILRIEKILDPKHPERLKAYVKTYIEMREQSKKVMEELMPKPKNQEN